MKKTVLLVLSLINLNLGKAQIQKKPLRVALFVSLYLDSTFDHAGNYQIKNVFPKQAISGLEFYEGASVAIDSINANGKYAVLEVFDVQSNKSNIQSLIEGKRFESFDLMIGQLGSSDFLQLSKIAKEKNIPLVSASYPNDGGIRNSPTVYLANPKINSHIQIIFNQIKNKWPESNIIWFRRANASDEKIEIIFKELNDSLKNGKINYKTVLLKELFINADVTSLIDTTKNNILIAGNLEEEFAKKIISAVATFEKKGQIQLVGMPTWENLKEIQNKLFSDIPIYYPSSFHIPIGNKWSANFEEYFKASTSVKPSSAAYRGFELCFYFLNMLQKYGSISEKHQIDKDLKIMTDFDFRPVKKDLNNGIVDYYENKRIYFLRRLNGVVTVQ